MAVAKLCSRVQPHEPHEWIGRRGLRVECPGVLRQASASESKPRAALTFGGTHLPDVPVLVNVEGCARCDCNHDAIEFRPFGKPMFVAGQAFSHWGMCPMEGEPILLGSRVPGDQVSTITYVETGNVD